MVRLFVGIEVSDEIRDTVARVQEFLAPALSRQGVRLVKPEKAHLTLVFLGNVDEESIGEVSACLDRAVAGGDGLTIELTTLGVFPTDRRPGVVWFGLNSGQSLLELQGRLAEGLEAFVEKPESRPYSPHLTLARISPASQKIGLALKGSLSRTAAEICGDRVVSNWKPSGIVLFQTMPDGSYEALHHSPLGGA